MCYIPGVASVNRDIYKKRKSILFTVIQTYKQILSTSDFTVSVSHFVLQFFTRSQIQQMKKL